MNEVTKYLMREWPNLAFVLGLMAVSYFGGMSIANRKPRVIEMATSEEMARNNRIAGRATVAFFVAPVVWLVLTK